MGPRMKRFQTFHEILVPLLVEGIGATTYLEFGLHDNQTISKVKCEKRIGVDRTANKLDGVEMFSMETSEFIERHAADLAPYDVVFLDADHADKAVLDDFYGIWPHVSPEGLVLLHDTNPETEKDAKPGLCDNAWEAAFEISSVEEAVTLPYCPGLTIVRKRESWGPS